MRRRRVAARVSSYVASVWPIAATTPAAESRRTASIPPGSSGARVTMRTAPSPAASSASTAAGSGDDSEPGLVRTGALRAEPRSLEVHAGEQSVADELGELADGGGHPGGGVGDQAGGHRRGAVGEVGGGHDLGGVRRTCVEGGASAAVHVEVDEAGGEDVLAEVDVGRAGRGALAHLDDPVAVEEQPPRREDPRRGDHLSCREDHVRPCCPARGSSPRWPGRSRPRGPAS